MKRFLKDAIDRNKIKIKSCNFKLSLYQSNDEMFLGVPQWSKRNRSFEYKNKWISEGDKILGAE